MPKPTSFPESLPELWPTHGGQPGNQGAALFQGLELSSLHGIQREYLSSLRLVSTLLLFLSRDRPQSPYAPDDGDGFAHSGRIWIEELLSHFSDNLIKFFVVNHPRL